MSRSAKAVAALSAVALVTVGFGLSQTQHDPTGAQKQASLRPAAVTAGVADGPEHRGRDLPETLPPDPALYHRLKADANKRRGHGQVPPVPVSAAPSTTLRKRGVSTRELTPSDSNGAIGTSRYVEVTNDQVAIYNTALTKIRQFSISALSQTSDAVGYDPDVTWDPKTHKFYFVSITQPDWGTNTYTLHMGYSKNPSPSSAADFCAVHFSTGTTLPDYPKIGGTSNFSLAGVNNYANASSYTGSWVYWLQKPGVTSLTTCPTTASGSVTGFPFSTVPAQQTDPSSTGYLLSASWSGGSTIAQYRVTGTTSPTIAAAGSYSVTPYSMPADAPLSNGLNLDTLDNRLWQVQQAVNPDLNQTVLYSSLTTFGGPGAAVNWFELSPTTTAPVQQGAVRYSTLYAFNGSISSDRRYVSYTNKMYGSAIIIGFNTASTTSAPAIRMVSKSGTNAQSGTTVITQSPGPDLDYSCPSAGDTCRWGDYSSMTPSPVSPTGAAAGQVWGTSMLDTGVQDANYANWATEMWQATP